jgi:hypothetical protein
VFYHAKQHADERGSASGQKLPDFASRIKAVYDVPSVALEGTASGAFTQADKYVKILRRALIVRHNIRRHAPHIREVSKQVLCRLLCDSLYETARDLENAIEGAAIRNTTSFGISLLPKPVWGDETKLDIELEEPDVGTIQILH